MGRVSEWMGVLADYTVGTVIVMTHMTVADRRNSRDERPLRSAAPTHAPAETGSRNAAPR